MAGESVAVFVKSDGEKRRMTDQQQRGVSACEAEALVEAQAMPQLMSICLLSPKCAAQGHHCNYTPTTTFQKSLLPVNTSAWFSPLLPLSLLLPLPESTSFTVFALNTSSLRNSFFVCQYTPSYNWPSCKSTAKRIG